MYPSLVFLQGKNPSSLNILGFLKCLSLLLVILAPTSEKAWMLIRVHALESQRRCEVIQNKGVHVCPFESGSKLVSNAVMNELRQERTLSAFLHRKSVVSFSFYVLILCMKCRDRYKTQHIVSTRLQADKESYLLDQSIRSVWSYLTQKKGFEKTLLPLLPLRFALLFNCVFLDVAILFSARFLSRSHHSVSVVLFKLTAVLHDRQFSFCTICTAQCTMASGLQAGFIGTW